MQQHSNTDCGIEGAPHRYSKEEEAEFVKRMKAGDMEARDLFIECLQPFVQGLARKYAAAYSWASSFIDYENIQSELNYMIMVLLVEKGAAELENPSGYVRRCIALKIREYCWKYARPITVPQRTDWNKAAGFVEAIASLDAPVGDDLTLLDQIAADPGSTKTAMTSEEDFRDLYEAIRVLPQGQRELINSAYALNQTPRAEGGVTNARLQTAHAGLRKILTQDPPEVVYARELAAWNAGKRTVRALVLELGLCHGSVRWRIGKMQEAGLINRQPGVQA